MVEKAAGLIAERRRELGQLLVSKPGKQGANRAEERFSKCGRISAAHVDLRMRRAVAQRSGELRRATPPPEVHNLPQGALSSR